MNDAIKNSSKLYLALKHCSNNVSSIINDAATNVSKMNVCGVSDEDIKRIYDDILEEVKAVLRTQLGVTENAKRPYRRKGDKEQ